VDLGIASVASPLSLGTADGLPFTALHRLWEGGWRCLLIDCHRTHWQYSRLTFDGQSRHHATEPFSEDASMTTEAASAEGLFNEMD
jgi:hypothetical protein